jgi:hypothetical protein
MLKKGEIYRVKPWAYDNVADVRLQVDSDGWLWVWEGSTVPEEDLFPDEITNGGDMYECRSLATGNWQDFYRSELEGADAGEG